MTSTHPSPPATPNLGAAAIVTMFNQKGGAGKTTFAINYAAQQARAGLQVLGVDTDPQGTMLDIYRAAGEPARFSVEANRNPETLSKLRNVRGLYDLIVVDTAGNLDGTLADVLASTDLAIIPCVPEFAYMRPTLNSARFCAAHGVDFRVLVNQVDPLKHTAPEVALRKFLAGEGLPTLETAIRRYTAWPQAQLDGVLIPDYRGRTAPRSAGSARDDLAAASAEISALLLRMARA